MRPVVTGLWPHRDIDPKSPALSKPLKQDSGSLQVHIV